MRAAPASSTFRASPSICRERGSESELLQILLSEVRSRPKLLTTAVEQLISTTFTGFAAWIAERAERPLAAGEADALAAVGLGSLFSSRLLRDVVGVSFGVDDETLVNTWVEIMATTLTDLPAP